MRAKECFQGWIDLNEEELGELRGTALIGWTRNSISQLNHRCRATMSNNNNNNYDNASEPTDGSVQVQAPQIDSNRGQSGLSNELKCYLLWHYRLLETKDRLAKLLAGKRNLFGIERRQVSFAQHRSTLLVRCS